MTTFASILLGALWSFAAGMIGYACGSDKDGAGIVGLSMAVVLFFVTLIFVVGLYS